MAETKVGANAAFDFFIEAYGVKYDRAVKCLTRDRADLLAFYDFPAEHWKHIRTTNPIESTFATVRHRTTKTKGCLSRQTALAMTHQLMLSAKKKWRKLDGQTRLPEIIEGIEFRDGIKHEMEAAWNRKPVGFESSGNRIYDISMHRRFQSRAALHLFGCDTGQYHSSPG